MDTLTVELAEFQSLKDLKPLLSSKGPCLSVFMQLSKTPRDTSAKANPLEWRELMRSIEPQVQQSGAEAREMFEAVSNWDAVIQGAEPQGESVAVFRSPEAFRVSWMSDPVISRAVFGPHFYIRPLLEQLTRGKTFYILALSQKDVRLLYCTMRTSEEVTLPPKTAANFDAWMDSAKPDHVMDNRSSPGPSVGSSKGVMFGTSTDREDKNEYLTHFYGQIDHGLNERLRGKTEPLVLAGVDYEIALYRSLNHYPHLAEESVEGAPNSLKSGEMHARAIDAILRCYEKKVDAELAEYNHKAGGGASNRLKEVVTAAHEGRVLTLLVSETLEATGRFDESTYTVKGRASGTTEDEDLVNDAAVQTILHAGQVYVAPNSKMPNGAPAAAIYRF